MQPANLSLLKWGGDRFPLIYIIIYGIVKDTF